MSGRTGQLAAAEDRRGRKEVDFERGVDSFQVVIRNLNLNLLLNALLLTGAAVGF